MASDLAMGPLGQPQEGLFGTVTVGLGTQDLTLSGVKIWVFGGKGSRRFGPQWPSPRVWKEEDGFQGSHGL